MLDLSSGDTVVFHLGMTGQLLVARARDRLVVHTHLRLGLEGETQLRFVDPVYGREGAPCTQCTTTLTRIIQSGRATFFCEVCQR